MSNANNPSEHLSASHPFERAGLGKAPFRFHSIVEQDLCYGERILNREEYQRTGIAMTTKPGGSCAYCGTYIRNMFRIESADGRKFVVGCDCLKKVDADKSVKGYRAARLKVERKAREAKKTAVRASLPAMIFPARRILRTLPSKNGWRAKEGETLLDWCVWMARNAGATGREKVAKVIRGVVKLAA